ncbi:MAG TPA: hypothetical protein VFE15_12340 [Marmoricola sp.]|jgi:lauroyl/myristoyl acyltransferase|nr:hypothetical protein [Marmoricola sp.]
MLVDLLQHTRRLVPARALPGMVSRRVDKLWESEEFRAQQERQMRYLLEFTDRAAEAPDLARGYTEQMMLRSYLRWHPRAITRQPVRNVERLTGRDQSRPLVMSFMHHARYDGLFASLSRAGATCHIMTWPDALEKTAPALIKQHIRVVRRGGPLVPATGGTAGLVAQMKPGVMMAIASDVASRTEIDFLGRRVLGSFGAARIAAITNSPVVLVTSHRDGDSGSYLQVHEALEPGDFADPGALLAEMMRLHGEAVLAWPEALDAPWSRWGHLDEPAP